MAADDGLERVGEDSRPPATAAGGFLPVRVAGGTETERAPHGGQRRLV